MIQTLSSSHWTITVDGTTHPLLGDSLFIGSDPMCEVTVRANGIASFHCELTFQGDHWVFNCEDLGTTLTLNGEILTTGIIRSGDLVDIGGIELEFIAPAFLLSAIPGFTSFDNFEDIDTTKPSLDLAETIQAKRIEVINYHNGHIQDVIYLPLRHGPYTIGPTGAGDSHIPFATIENSELFTINQRKVQFHPHPDLIPSEEWKELSLGNTIFLTKGAEQVSLRIVHQGVQWKKVRSDLDRDFWKIAAIVGLFILIPFLALQFIDLPRIEPKKPDVVVIYKLKETNSAEEKNAPSENPTETVAEAAAAPDGSESPEVTPSEAAPEALVAEQAANPEPPPKAEPTPAKPEIVKVSESKPAPTPKAKPLVKPVALTKPAPVVASASETEKAKEIEKEPIQDTQTVAEVKEEKVAPAPKKTYSFNTGLTKSLVGPATEMKLKVAQTKLAGSSTSFTTGTKADKRLVGKMNQGPGKLSAESSGSSISSSSRGIASKSGFDTSSIDKNTVVRGSMDPEVLRRILREYIPQFRHCYQQELIYNSEKIKGILDLDFTINAQGKTSRYTVHAKDAQFSQRGKDCMGKVLVIIEFPKPKGGGIVDVTQPLNFFAEK